MVSALQRTPRLVWKTDRFADSTREYVKVGAKKNECGQSEKSELVPW